MGKILFYPFLIGIGHLGICLTLSKNLLKKYKDKHEIYFIVNSAFEEKLKKKYPSIKFVVYEQEVEKKDDDEFLKTLIGKFGQKWCIKDKTEFVSKTIEDFSNFIHPIKKSYDQITEIIKKIKPDIILYDHVMTTPIGTDQGIPFSCIVSAAPTILCLPNLPPHQSNLPTEYNEENLKKWKEFIEKAFLSKEYKRAKKILNDWLKEKNCDLIDSHSFLTPSPYFNIYNYPSAVDYFDDIVKLPGNWLKLESAVLPPLPLSYEVPEKLSKLEGKLIYISMGSFSSAYKPLMERLINIISQLPHRFILSAGVYHEEFNLSENIYAEKFTNQLAVLQSVDLMISHGGNNTFTECFYFGVPQIILPLFGDQLENGNRIKDKGLGETFSPFECTKEDLADAIDKLTTKEMKQKYKEISYKIQQDKSIDKICEKIVSYCN